MSDPSNGNGDRGPRGQFAPGNKLATGNPSAGRVERFRHLLVSVTSPDDVLAIWQRLIEDAKAGERHAVHEVLNRLLGKASQPLEVSPGPDGAGVTFTLHLGNPRNINDPTEDA